MKIRIQILDDGNYDRCDVTVAGDNSIRELSAELLYSPMAQHTMTCLQLIEKEARRTLLGYGVEEPTEEELGAAMRHVKLRDLNLHFDELNLPKQPN